MKITISIMNLGTCEWKYYDISNLNDYNNAMENFNETMNLHNGDFEVQLIESNTIGITDDNLYNVLKIKSEHDEWVSIIASIYNHYNNERDTLEVLNNQYYDVVYGDDEVEAMQSYVLDRNILQIPEELEFYIDWNKVYRDYNCSGYITINIDNNRWLVLQPW